MDLNNPPSTGNSELDQWLHSLVEKLRYVRGVDCEYMEMKELPSNVDEPGANRFRIFAKDNGAGKTQLCVRFNNGGGAADVVSIATES